MHIEVKSFWNRGSKQSVTSGLESKKRLFYQEKKYIPE